MKKTHIVGLIVIAICIGILLTALGSTGEYATFRQAKSHPDKQYHVVGRWNHDAMIYNPAKDPNYFVFNLKDKEGVIEKVVFHSEKPQDFEKSEKIVIEGKAEGDHFEASSILMKCPSKYNNTEVKVKKSLTANSDQ